MSITAMAQDSALRLGPATPSLDDLVEAAAKTAADAAAGGAPALAATSTGTEAAKSLASNANPVASSSPLTELVKYIPTETLTLYVALQGALGEITAPQGKTVADANFGSRWASTWIMLVVTVVLTIGLSYRAQKQASPEATFKLPYFEVIAAAAAFLVWAFSLPTSPLRDFARYDYNAWNSFLILAGTVTIATLAYVLGKSVTWQKVPGTGIS